MRDGRHYFRPRLAFSAAWRNRASEDRGEAQAAAKAGGFRDTMLPHMDAAYNLARYLARDPHAAEDIVQDAFLRAFRGFAAFRGEAPKAWLFAILRNCFLDWLDAHRDDPIALDGQAETQAEARAVDEDTPEAILARGSEARMVRSTIDNLPEPFRETIVLRELEELSYKEIAMVTGVPIGTVMSRLARGRQILCDLLLPGDEQERAARS